MEVGNGQKNIFFSQNKKKTLLQSKLSSRMTFQKKKKKNI